MMSWLNPFDFNRDGKISMDEGFLEYMVMEECMKPAPSNYRRKRRHTSDMDSLSFPNDGLTWPDAEQGRDEEIQPDFSWREKYADNPFDVDPLTYDTEEDFLWVYEAVSEKAVEIYTQLIRDQLEFWKKKHDFRIAVALVFMMLNSHFTSPMAEFVTELLLKEVYQYGMTREYIEGIARQMSAAIADYERDPSAEKSYTFHV